jgi:hypothetical protein
LKGVLFGRGIIGVLDSPTDKLRPNIAQHCLDLLIDLLLIATSFFVFHHELTIPTRILSAADSPGPSLG